MGQNIGYPTFTKPPGLSYKMGLTSIYFPIIEKQKDIPLTTFSPILTSDKKPKSCLASICTKQISPSITSNCITLSMIVQLAVIDKNIISDIYWYVRQNPDKINEVANYNNSYTALHYACRYSARLSIDVVKFLIANGADVNAKDQFGITPLIVAAHNSNKNGNIETVELLLDNGAHINHQKQSGETALMHAVLFSKNSLATVTLLLDKGADPNIKSITGETALMLSASRLDSTSSFDTVKLLVERGANINCWNNDGITVLGSAIYNLETVQYLLSKGGIVNVSNFDIINHALSKTTCNPEVIMLLIAKGANTGNLDKHTLKRITVMQNSLMYTKGTILSNQSDRSDQSVQLIAT